MLTFVRSTDPQCMRALLGSGVLMPIIRSPDPSVSGALVCLSSKHRDLRDVIQHMGSGSLQKNGNISVLKSNDKYMGNIYVRASIRGSSRQQIQINFWWQATSISGIDVLKFQQQGRNGQRHTGVGR
ncbi:hypothetical protein ACLOJK_003711 [Asimina triloba]